MCVGAFIVSECLCACMLLCECMLVYACMLVCARTIIRVCGLVHVGWCMLVHFGQCWCVIVDELLMVHAYCDAHVGVCKLVRVCCCMLFLGC